mmetsp:Transcript_33724/g.53621  ORF Transcript_33724/g.53621 Transcript_33724/m.53621 type:complete len:188 (+) Transcript_33724:79-642(+)|eukprot:CAMPEP_0169137278 /NCGR_PEP_ID=MMETSP1015-20121227/41440_1 /TAXON_ID=342587 /ORGANISM="Karlodinium micrum, Strain CCMP2283" /LENGTH=187 /DNA_ID=CAMNT_0009202085 /DNA_START=74 /DNA_END=637 /DNA_ORIENTATION=+
MASFGLQLVWLIASFVGSRLALSLQNPSGNEVVIKPGGVVAQDSQSQSRGSKLVRQEAASEGEAVGTQAVMAAQRYQASNASNNTNTSNSSNSSESLDSLPEEETGTGPDNRGYCADEGKLCSEAIEYLDDCQHTVENCEKWICDGYRGCLLNHRDVCEEWILEIEGNESEYSCETTTMTTTLLDKF